MAWELCTKENVVNVHPFPIDELEDEWSDYVEALIRRQMGTPYLGTTQALINETHNGDGTPLLIVRQPPIISVQAVRISAVASSAADYVVFQNYIQMVAENFPEGNLNVQIDYTSGDETVDPIITLTAASMIAAILNYRKRYGADSSIMWANPDMQTGETTPNLNVGLTSHLHQIMKRMLRRERIRAS